MRVELTLRHLRLRAPLTSARQTVATRPLIELTLTDGDGVAGRGEAAPLPGYDGVTVEAALAGLEACRPVLERAADPDHHALLADCAERTLLPQSLAAIDLALWDLAGRRAGEPVWRLLGAPTQPQVEVNATIGAEDRLGAAREAAAAATRGFGTVKLKVGIGDDAGRVAATRAAAGPEARIRLDANGVWSVPEALAALRALEPAGIECCEEPVHGGPALAAVTAGTAVPIAADESGSEVLGERVCAAVCLKIARCGGITGVIRDARRARATGYEVYLASTLDGPLGIAAALHAAAVVVPDRPCGLATLERFDGPDPFMPVSGVMTATNAPGLIGELDI